MGKRLSLTNRNLTVSKHHQTSYASAITNTSLCTGYSYWEIHVDNLGTYDGKSAESYQDSIGLGLTANSQTDKYLEDIWKVPRKVCGKLYVQLDILVAQRRTDKHSRCHTNHNVNDRSSSFQRRRLRRLALLYR